MISVELIVTIVFNAVFIAMGVFYAWLTSDILKELWDDKMAKRRLKRARKKEGKGIYYEPPLT